MKLNLDYKKILTEVLTASLIIVISAIAIISFIIISDQEVKIYKTNSKVDIIKGTSRIEEVLNILESKYVGEIDINTLIDGAVEGIFSKIDDPYTRYLTAEEYDAEVNSGKEEYTGIGVHLIRSPETGHLTITGVMPDSPAKKVGLLSGDIIIKIDDKEITAKDTNASELIKGKIGTDVKLTIKRVTTIIDKTMKRDKIQENNVESEMLSENIAYIKILQFSNGVYDQFKTEYNSLVIDKKAIGLILDLRNNPGGFVEETVKIADMLNKEGVILETVYKNDNKQVYKSDSNQIKVPLAVLINGSSASASEILAGSVKDLKQGILIGEKTYGKGIVQSIIGLQGKGGVSVTTAEYYTASGNKIQKEGIKPDIKVTLPKAVQNLSVIPFDQDTQIKSAINYIKSK